MIKKDTPANTSSFGEHYLRHVALGEGCNCAESVLRTLRRSPLPDDDLGTVCRALWARMGRIVARVRRLTIGMARERP